jgi:hypothetical protein
MTLLLFKDGALSLRSVVIGSCYDNMIMEVSVNLLYYRGYLVKLFVNVVNQSPLDFSRDHEKYRKRIAGKSSKSRGAI